MPEFCKNCKDQVGLQAATLTRRASERDEMTNWGLSSDLRSVISKSWFFAAISTHTPDWPNTHLR